MARTNSTHNKKIYLSIVGGRFAEKVDKDTAGAVSRKNKKEEIVWEILNDKTSGVIKNMKIDSNESFGKQLILSMEDIGEEYSITIPVESRYFDGFCNKIQSADLSKQIELAPYSFLPSNSENKKVGMNIYQDGKKLEYFYSKEDQKGKPFPDSEKLEDDEYKIFKIRERKFFCALIEELNAKLPLYANKEVNTQQENSSDDLPF